MKQIYNKIHHLCYASIILVAFGWATAAHALIFDMPPSGNDIVGKVQWMQAVSGDNFNIIGRRYDVGYFELLEANPGVDPDKVPTGTIVVIPTRFVLPPVAHKGIIISLAEMRLYYFTPDGRSVITYPVGVGRQGWCSPLGITKIIQKTVNPVWNVPASIKKDRAAQGVTLPNSVQPGPENPLGGYCMRLGIDKQTFLIHGTNDFTGVGRRSSSGCVRMLPEDVEYLFQKVAVGTQVNIINSAYKAGWENNKLYLESHVPLQEQEANGNADLNAMRNVVNGVIKNYSGMVYWNKATRIAKQQNGVPQVIGTRGVVAVSDAAPAS